MTKFDGGRSRPWDAERPPATIGMTLSVKPAVSSGGLAPWAGAGWRVPAMLGAGREADRRSGQISDLTGGFSPVLLRGEYSPWRPGFGCFVELFSPAFAAAAENEVRQLSLGA